jgi:carboxy-terminal domain RNA polymerase II polypeptide A small phosphatase
MADKALLVLDLDETLVHATESPLAFEPQHEVPPYFLYRRPGLREFLLHVSGLFRLAVWTSSRVLVVDDSPEKHTRNYGNLVQVSPFMGDPRDDELPHLAAYLTQLAPLADVRGIEKRQWRRRLAADG